MAVIVVLHISWDLRYFGPSARNGEDDMRNPEQRRQVTAPPLQDSIDAACDEWLDRALEDTFPASDPLASYSFD
jgi:hypothetical protein